MGRKEAERGMKERGDGGKRWRGRKREKERETRDVLPWQIALHVLEQETSLSSQLRRNRTHLLMFDVIVGILDGECMYVHTQWGNQACS